MRRFVTITAATVVAAMLSAPAVLAQDIEPWSAFGQYEPSTTLDTPDLMWHTGPGLTKNRVYFNAFTGYPMISPGTPQLGVFAHTGNVGAIKTQNEAYGAESQMAIFGVWSDCNGDGYIGHAESGLFEYKSELLFDNSICPPIAPQGSNAWVRGAHNYRGWVTELIPISRDDPTVAPGNRDQRVYYDPEAKVWGDYGVPDQFLEPGSAGGACALSPVPRGTFATTAGVINYLDCNAAFIDFWNIAAGAEAAQGLGLEFENEDDATGSWADMQLFGPDSTDNSAVYVWDCGSPYAARSGDVLNMTPAGEPTSENPALHNAEVWNVAPAVGNTANPTIPGTFNHTNEGFDDCDTSNDRGAEFYGTLNEGDVAPDTSAGKADAEWNFRYSTSNRGEAPWNIVGQASGNAGTPTNLGAYNTGYSGWDCFCITFKLFQTPGVRTGLGEVDATDPTTITNANPGVDDATPYLVSYYAFVGSRTFGYGLVTPGGSGIYGSAQCGDADEGVVNGWDCDASNWYVNADGTLPDDIAQLGKVGDVYNLRDVDCYDGSNDLGVPTQFPGLGSTPCTRLV